jgi:hypothetical protein
LPGVKSDAVLRRLLHVLHSLKEKLNSVRISDLTHEVDARIIILERAMSNVNHGEYVPSH